MIHYILTYRSNQMLRWHDRYRKVIVLYVMSSRTYGIQRRSVRIQPPSVHPIIDAVHRVQVSNDRTPYVA